MSSLSATLITAVQVPAACAGLSKSDFAALSVIMFVMGQMLEPKKTEITEKLRQEINKVRLLCWRQAHVLWLSTHTFDYIEICCLSYDSESIHRNNNV